MVGFVFFPRSPRHVDFETARALGQQVRGRAQKVALTVDADDDLLHEIVETLQPDILQLHGKEKSERAAAIKRRFSLPIMKAIAVETQSDLTAVAAYATIADYLLFDARPPQTATRPGGLGRPFDWSLLRSIALDMPFMLSGGLHADNVDEALRVTAASGVDVSSGVERAAGEKDPDKIRAFVRAARDAAARLAVKPVASPA